MPLGPGIGGLVPGSADTATPTPIPTPAETATTPTIAHRIGLAARSSCGAGATALVAASSRAISSRSSRIHATGEARTIHLTLEDSCRGVVCPMGQACRSGQCGSIEPPDAGPPGADAGDAGPPPPCAVDVDCSDGNPSNGSEQCEMGECVSGDPLDCDDHVGCTRDSRDGTECVHLALDTACLLGASGRCDPMNDCQYTECTAATCAPTGCQTATCMGSTGGGCLRPRDCP